CSRTRSDHTKTPGCRSVLAAIVDEVVAPRLLQVVAPEEIALALAAADEVADRHARSRRALELRVERADYDGKERGSLGSPTRSPRHAFPVRSGRCRRSGRPHRECPA